MKDDQAQSEFERIAERATLKRLIARQDKDLKQARKALKEKTEELDRLHDWMAEHRDIVAITLAWKRDASTVLTQLNNVAGRCPAVDDVEIFDRQAMNLLDDIIGQLERTTAAYKTARSSHRGVVDARDDMRALTPIE